MAAQAIEARVLCVQVHDFARTESTDFEREEYIIRLSIWNENARSSFLKCDVLSAG